MSKVRLLLVLGALCSWESQAQQCEYPIADLSACPRRTARADHTPTVNECGPEGSTLKFPQGFGLADFTAPCNAHDVCYETCNSNKDQCDAALAESARAECLRAYPHAAPGAEDEAWGRRATCMSRARKYGSAVSTFGKAAYEAAQKLACECCPTSSRIQVRARYSKAGQLLTAFVTANVTDEGFQFEMSFPVRDEAPQATNFPGGGATSLVDSRAGCVVPTLGGVWDELSATRLAIVGSYLTVEGTKSVPAVTLGVGEGDCATMTRTEVAMQVPNGLQIALPLELLSSATPPSAPLTMTQDGWTFTYTTLP